MSAPVLVVCCGPASLTAAVVEGGTIISSHHEQVPAPEHLPVLVDALVSRVLVEADLEVPAAVGYRLVPGDATAHSRLRAAWPALAHLVDEVAPTPAEGADARAADEELVAIARRAAASA